MRLHHVVLLAVVALVVSVDAALDAINVKGFQYKNDISTKRFLGADTTKNDDGEERAINIKSITGLDKLKKIPGLENLKKVSSLFKSKITPGTLLDWAKKGKSPESVFTKLKLDKVTADKLFDNSDFKIWFAYTNLAVKNEPEQAMLNILTGRYGDIAMTSMIEKATKVSGTQEKATKLQSQQMKTWSELGMSRNQVFAVLNLDKGVDKVLSNPNLNVWIKYVDDFTVKKKSEAPLIDTLRANYKDSALLGAFKKAQSSPEASTKKLGENLEAALVSQLRLRRVRNGN